MVKIETLDIDSIKEHNELFMREALKLARSSLSKGEVPIGAVIVSHGEIIGMGDSTVIGSNDPTAHAEIKAIRQACQSQNNYRLKNAVLYTTLEPCMMCAGAIIEARIDRVIIGALDKKRGAVVSNLSLFTSSISNHIPDIEYGILAEECGSILSDFFKSLRTKK